MIWNNWSWCCWIDIEQHGKASIDCKIFPPTIGPRLIRNCLCWCSKVCTRGWFIDVRWNWSRRVVCCRAGNEKKWHFERWDENWWRVLLLSVVVVDLLHVVRCTFVIKNPRNFAISFLHVCMSCNTCTTCTIYRFLIIVHCKSFAEIVRTSLSLFQWRPWATF